MSNLNQDEVPREADVGAPAQRPAGGPAIPAGGMPPVLPGGNNRGDNLTVVRIVSAGLILLVAVVVALSPGVVYAPTPKVVLYMLVSLLFGILVGSEATAQLKLEGPGFLFTTVGTGAVVLGALLLLVNLSKPESQITVFHVYDEQGNDVSLEWGGALRVETGRSGLQATTFTDGNTLVLIFPEQLGEVIVRVRKSSSGPVYEGAVAYGGARQSRLELGKDLKTRPTGGSP